MLLQLVRIEGDPHGYALHDLDPVASRVLRRKQREGRARSRSESSDRAVILHAASVHIAIERHRLPDTNIRELRLLEVRIDPYLVQRDHGHQGRAGADSLTELHASLCDESRDRRGKLRALV